MSSPPIKIPELIAHRGNAAEYPENTLPALRSALELGVRFVEFDVQLTVDRQPILLLEGFFSEDELVGGLGGLVDVATSFLGGSLAFDLADLLGGLSDTGLPLGELQPRLIGARSGPTDGVTIVMVSLWD